MNSNEVSKQFSLVTSQFFLSESPSMLLTQVREANYGSSHSGFPHALQQPKVAMSRHFEAKKLQNACTVAVSSAISCIVCQPLYSSLQKGVLNDFATPRLSDITLIGVETAAFRSLIRWGLLELSSDSVNRSIESLQYRLTGKDEKSAKTVLLSAAISALAVNTLLNPIDRIRRVQLVKSCDVSTGFQSILHKEGMKGFSRGIIPTVMNALPNVMIRSVAQYLAQGNAEKEKQLSLAMSMLITPPKTYLEMVKLNQQSLGLGFSDARRKVLAGMQARPKQASLHFCYAFALVYIGNHMFFESKRTLSRSYYSEKTP